VATRFPRQNENCILCGLCVEVCAKNLGLASISFVGRGSRRRVMAPFGRQSADCIGCGACAAVCPTGAVEVQDEGAERTISTWNTKLPRAQCRRCQKPFGTIQQCDSVMKRTALHGKALQLCPACRREVAAESMSLHCPPHKARWDGV
jgi:predicted molibdopterin-dependent oxidoreductase YjgC